MDYPESSRIEARFEAKYIPVPESGCWLWEGPVTGDGYGVFEASIIEDYLNG
jgi:hypothetical protein